MRHNFDHRPWFTIALGAACLVVAVVLAAIEVRDCRRQDECLGRGGAVEHYNYRTILVPVSCGSNCTVLVPEQVSDWRCVGGRAEAVDAP